MKNKRQEGGGGGRRNRVTGTKGGGRGERVGGDKGWIVNCLIPSDWLSIFLNMNPRSRN